MSILTQLEPRELSTWELSHGRQEPSVCSAPEERGAEISKLQLSCTGDDSKVLNVQGEDQKLVMKLRSLLWGGQTVKNFQSIKETLKALSVSFV